MTEYTEYIEYMQYDSEQRRSKLESLIQTLVTNEQDRFNFLQEIYHFETDTNIREYIQGQLQAQNAIPIPDSEWPMHGCDGKAYTRQQMLNIPDLFICDPVDRASFFSKPNGHIKILFDDEGIPSDKNKSIGLKIFEIIGTVGLGIFFLGFCPLCAILAVFPGKHNPISNTASAIYVIGGYGSLAVGITGLVFTWYISYQRRKNRLEKHGKLYLGILRSVIKESSISYSSKGKKIKNFSYRALYVFKNDNNELLFESRIFKGENRNLETALTLPSGTPVAILYSKEYQYLRQIERAQGNAFILQLA